MKVVKIREMPLNLWTKPTVFFNERRKPKHINNFILFSNSTCFFFFCKSRYECKWHFSFMFSWWSFSRVLELFWILDKFLIVSLKEIMQHVYSITIENEASNKNKIIFFLWMLHYIQKTNFVEVLSGKKKTKESRIEMEIM